MYSTTAHNAYMVDQGMAGRLRRARELDGRFKEATEAARALGVSVSTYLSHENGSRGFRASAGKYAGFYKINLIWLLEGIGTPKSRSADARFLDLTPDEQSELERFANFLRSKRPQPKNQ